MQVLQIHTPAELETLAAADAQGWRPSALSLGASASSVALVASMEGAEEAAGGGGDQGGRGAGASVCVRVWVWVYVCV